ncbi:putative ubiquitin carboxyl-terminal hydrolase 3 [Smittium mucronatum]|uniref:Ubiquitin carboxyl-terminal hydrolase n=1 Tax=Smittium mucronatum TaxID=133383 RepID=A0A1R0H2U7_9FUNG|nr:putative ubiquitin carboxyl-terminal hydrolase 3 [Smittium mucronatum]
MDDDSDFRYFFDNLSIIKEYKDLKQMFSKYPVYIPLNSQNQWNDAEKPLPEPKKAPSSWAALLKPADLAISPQAKIESTPFPLKTKKKVSLKEMLTKWSFKKTHPLFKPRGLENTGNMCFMNVVLQVLLYCDYFYSLLIEIQKTVSFRFNSSIPLIESLIMFVKEFKPISNPFEIDEFDPPFVPTYVYDALRKKGIFQTSRGQQEDAQEFLSHLINGMHDELLQVMNSNKEGSGNPSGNLGFASPIKSLSPEIEPSNSHIESDSSVWLQVGKKNKTNLTRSLDFAQTPISRIFGGYMSSELKIPGSKTSITIEPFQNLALDISNPEITDLEDALNELFSPEVIEGYINSSGVSVNATRQQYIDELPHVFIIILNRVVYSPELGIHKLNKFVSYSETFNIPQRWISPPKRSKFTNTEYTLSSVLYHHGELASGGHYTCDVNRRPGEWLRFDDTEILNDLSLNQVLCEKEDRSSYVLLYTRPQ